MKKITITIVLLLVAASNVFASQTNIQLDQLQNTLDTILGFFTSDIMRAIFAIGLAGMLVGLGLKRDDPEIKKRFLMWAIAIGGLLGLSSIMDLVFSTGALL